MEHSRVALPERSYLARVGEVAYTVASMEWTILGDLHRLAAKLPDSLSLDRLEPETTAGIATRVKAATAATTDEPTREYLKAVYRALYKAAAIRSDVSHARPATDQNGLQRLARAEILNKKITGVRFWIDDEWFDESIHELNDLLSAIDDRRPSLS